jgi:hypothetical protein
MTDDSRTAESLIHELMSDYAWGNDVRDIGLIVSCFTEDGGFGLQIAGQEPVGPFRGRPALVEFMGSALLSQTDQRRHVITNVKLTRVSADEYAARSYLTLAVTDGGATRIATTGWYEDTIVLEGGRWLIGDRWLWLDGQF